MDDEAIQKGAPVVPLRGPMTPDYEPDRRFAWQALDKDKQHLKTLSIFYFILAGLSAFGAVMSLLYIPFGLFFLLAAPPSTSGGPPPAFGYIFMGIGAFGMIFNGVYGYMLYLVGKSLREYKRPRLIFVMAILICVLGGVLGIILGIFTLVVLNRESVKELFAHGDAAYPEEVDA